MRIFHIIFLVIFVSSSSLMFGQQTPQTSFFTNSTAFWNPAYVGVDNQLAINTFLRQQWLGFGASAPRHIAVDFQYPFVDYNMAASGALVYDQTGPVSKRGVVANYSYQLRDLGNRGAILSLGITAGANQYVFNASNEVINQEVDPLLNGGNGTGFFPSVGGGFYYVSSEDRFRNNTNFFLGASYLQGYAANVLISDYNQERSAHLVVDVGSRIYGRDYMFEPRLSINYSNPELINVLAGLTFEMENQFWLGAGYSNIQELTVQGGYIFDEVAGRDTRLRLGALGSIGFGDRLQNFGPSAELYIRYELDMD